MITERALIIRKAREWLGTPYHHQASLKGVGCDCAGLVIGVYAELGMNLPNVPTDYSATPSNGTLISTVSSYGYEVAVPLPGDVMVLKFLNEPHHLAFYAGNSMIHSYAPVGRVVEHAIDTKWARRIVGYWRYKEVVG